MPSHAGRSRSPPLAHCVKDRHEQRAKPPASIAELFQWPERMYDALSPEERSCLKKNLETHLEIYSQFSGMATPEQALHMIFSKMSEKLNLGHNDGGGPGGAFSCVEVCDRNEQCRLVLQNLSGIMPEHVFGDVADRLPAKVQQELRTLQGVLDSKETSLQEKEESLADIQNTLANSKIVKLAYCYRHKKMCSLWKPPASRVDHQRRMHIAGTPCVDWSSMGKRGGLLGSTSVAFHIWISEMKHRRPSVIIHECTPKFEPHLLAEAMKDADYLCESVLLCPTMCGVPTTRLRRFTVLWRTDMWGAHQTTSCDLGYAPLSI